MLGCWLPVFYFSKQEAVLTLNAGSRDAYTIDWALKSLILATAAAQERGSTPQTCTTLPRTTSSTALSHIISNSNAQAAPSGFTRLSTGGLAAVIMGGVGGVGGVAVFIATIFTVSCCCREPGGDCCSPSNSLSWEICLNSCDHFCSQCCGAGGYDCGSYYC